MNTAVTLAAWGVDQDTADRFFERIRELEAILSRFRPDSGISRLAAGRLDLDDAEPEVRDVLARCEALRRLTRGDFEHEPGDPVLDPNAVAKGWIVDDAATVLRMTGADFFVNAGGDIVARRGPAAPPWRVGIQHPDHPTAVLGILELRCGAVATSGAYERGDHIRSSAGAALRSVTVVGPDMGEADGLATAVFASGQSPPAWWGDVDPAYGLLTLSGGDRLRWAPPSVATGVVWRSPASSHFPGGAQTVSIGE